MVIDKKKHKMLAPKTSNRKLLAYSVCCLAVILTALAGMPLGLPQVALESTQWALVASLGLFSGANVGEHFASKPKTEKEIPDAEDK